MDRIDIVCLGELLVDMFPAEIGRSLEDVSAFRPVPGGAPANVAVAAARLGALSAFVGKVGDDAFGHHLAVVLAQEGVDTGGVRFDAQARTTINFMAQPDPDSYVCLFYRNPGADMLLRADELDRELLQRARALHFGSLSLAQEPSRAATLEAVRIVREAGGLISLDVNYRPTLWGSAEEFLAQAREIAPQADLLKVNEVELALLTGAQDVQGELPQAAADLWGRTFRPDEHWKVCVVTLGKSGSYYRTATAGAFVPTFQVKTVDATGCGDSFIAALLCQVLAYDRRDWRAGLEAGQLARALVYANAAGALTALTQGVIPSLPTAGAVEAFLAQHGR
jgi:fructokinase